RPRAAAQHHRRRDYHTGCGDPRGHRRDLRLNGFFVTGTDTGVGKTRVVAALAAALRARGIRVLAAKPAESGGGDDALQIAEAAGHPPVCRYRFPLPVAPGVAAEPAGITIDFGLI